MTASFPPVDGEGTNRLPELPDGLFRAMVETSVSPFVLVDAEGYVTWVGPRVVLLLGEPAEAYVGRHFLDIIHPTSHPAAIAAFGDFVADASDEGWIGPPMVLDLVRHDGSVVSCEVSASLGANVGLAGAVLQVRRSRGTPLLYDAVDALAVGAPLPDVLRRLALLCEEDTPDSTVVIGLGWDGERFRDVAASGGTLAAAAPSLDRSGPSPWKDAMTSGVVVGGGELDPSYPDLATEAREAGFATCWVVPITVRGERQASAALVLWRQRPGTAQPHRTTTAQRVARLVAFAIESAHNVSRLRRAATTDELTGLANRGAQHQTLSALLATSDPAATTSLLFCDLDDFKPINDAHGHDFGDRVLAVVAERMRDAIRASDHLARWGGDEFVVACTTNDWHEAVALAERLIAAVRAPIAIDGDELAVGLSIGIATAGPGTTADDLVRRADDALRDAKVAGKNTWRSRDTPTGAGQAGEAVVSGG